MSDRPPVLTQAPDAHFRKLILYAYLGLQAAFFVSLVVLVLTDRTTPGVYLAQGALLLNGLAALLIRIQGSPPADASTSIQAENVSLTQEAEQVPEKR